MNLSVNIEKKLIRVAPKINKFSTGIVVLFSILFSEIIYFIIAVIVGIQYHLIGYFAAFIIPALTAYPLLWTLLRITRIVQRQNEEIEIKNSLKNTLLSVVAHDVKGPLINIDALLTLYFQKEINPKELSELMTELQVQVKNNLDFVMNILQWTKAQFDGFQIIKTQIELEPLVHKIVEAYQFQIQQKKLKIETEVQLTAYIDCNLVRLVIRNLLSNAIKYSYPGGIIKIKAFVEAQKLILEVSDSGTGIDQACLTELFDENSLSLQDVPSLETGTGMGLRLCKTFIDALGGTIGARSIPQKGSTFYFSMPQQNS